MHFFYSVHNNKSGCPKCGKLKKAKARCVSDAILHNRLIGRGIDMLFYSGTTVNKDSVFYCTTCSLTWKSSYNNIDNGHGCPNCNKNGGFNQCKPAYLYILLLSTDKGDCYGFGITVNIKDRMTKHKRNLKKIGYTVLEEYSPIYFESGVDAKQLESKWKQSPHIVSINVEGFVTECVLVNAETTKMIFNT